MGMDIQIIGAVSGTGAEVNALRHIKVVTETDAIGNPGNIGAIRILSENDQGLLTGVPRLASPEVDADYRVRVSQDLVLDEEVYNYSAQTTGKHNNSSTTMTASWTPGKYTSNASGITTANTGVQHVTYAAFPNNGTQTLSCDVEVGFSAQPVANVFVEFGLGLPGTALTAPTDGVFIRLNSGGLLGIASNAGTETPVVFPLLDGAGLWTYSSNKRYQFIIYVCGVAADFWVNDGTGAVKLGSISLPTAQGRICMAQGLQFFFKQRHVGGAAGGVLQAMMGAYNVRLGGSNVTSTMGTQGNRVMGSYQGMSGATQGSLANYANNANPTMAIPTNTTAALGIGLGGQFWEIDTLAVNTDGIISSFQVPAVTANVQGRRLVLRGVKISSFVQTTETGGGYVAQWSLAFGHTNVALTTAEAANTKASRRLPLGLQAVAANAAAGVVLSDIWLDLGDAPVFVNPGEFVQIVKKKIGTAPTAGVIGHLVILVYGWE